MKPETKPSQAEASSLEEEEDMDSGSESSGSEGEDAKEEEEDVRRVSPISITASHWHSSSSNSLANRFLTPLFPSSSFHSSFPSSSQENISYGTFDFTSGRPVPTYLAKKHKKKKNLKALLKAAEKRQQKLKELDGTEEGKVRLLMRCHRLPVQLSLVAPISYSNVVHWFEYSFLLQKLKQELSFKAALARAQGEKLKDDPKKLKLSIKRRQKQKEKSAKAWYESSSLANSGLLPPPC